MIYHDDLCTHGLIHPAIISENRGIYERSIASKSYLWRILARLHIIGSMKTFPSSTLPVKCQIHPPLSIISICVLSRWWWMCSGLTPPPDTCQGPVPGSSERRIWRFLSSPSNFFCIKDCTGTRPTHHREMAIHRVGDLLNGVSGDRCCDAICPWVCKLRAVSGALAS